MSKFLEAIKVIGTPHIVLTDKYGNIKQEFSVPNLVVNAGKTIIAARLVGSGGVLTHMALGTGTTAALVANTALQAETARVDLSSQSSSGATSQYVASFGAGVATGAITEAGIFTASSGGNMLCRTVFAVVNKSADDIMSITWSLTIQ